MKKALKFIFVVMPNLPFIVIIAIFCVYKIFTDTNIVELYMMDEDWYPPKEITDLLKKTFPKEFFRIFALIFWLSLITLYL